ncbi:TlpA disulfide reductase family protein [Campylobacter sp. US33a]|uniref:TlpA family protein disulfide reductase n=1 Tax=Campylobacter sp. US33a TaxID=2498120 RepID=UPI001068702C|nr:TlpA disulfide reductase family protein [Campylobacter sp. US33a]TEY03432.1 TlpA family protein disulfide reductase [Campylobacter sp. US33a]
MYKKILFLFSILLVFNACDNKSKEQDLNVSTALLTQGDKVNFSLKTNDGKNIFIKANSDAIEFENEGKATLFVFFATWCQPCLAEIPHLNKLQEKYKESFKVVGVLLEDMNNENLSAFINQYKINYSISLGEGNYLLAKSIGGIEGIPTMVLYDNNSKMINLYTGLIPEEMLDIDIQRALL